MTANDCTFGHYRKAEVTMAIKLPLKRLKFLPLLSVTFLHMLNYNKNTTSICDINFDGILHI